MLYYLCYWEHFFGPLRLFRYVTVRATMALLTALLISFLWGPRIFRWLRRKNFKDVQRDAATVHVLSTLHENKKNVPTMGGIAIILSITVACVLWMRFNVYSIGALMVGLALAAVGAVDDGLKLKFKNAKGVASHWKWLVQGLSTFVLLYLLLSTPDVGNRIDGLCVTFFKNPWFTALPAVVLFLYWFLVIAGTSNALNLTDGIDGLAIGCTLTVALTYSVFSYVTGHIKLSQYLNLPYLNGVEELTVLCLALAGAGLGFLWYNAHPAEIIMGDTGSLALGAWIGCIALMTQQAFTLIIVGFVFVVEALSVIAQVTSFKLFHRRCLKMSPLHHHFELLHIPESKIIVRFWIVSLLCALLGLMTLKLR